MNNGAEALTVSVNETATCLRLIREQTTVPNLLKRKDSMRLISMQQYLQVN